MPSYRVCKSFTVESGHMLSKHPERCRYPHGHSRRIEVVVSSDELDSQDMVLDFKALKLALKPYIERYDHSMALNSSDPLRPTIEQVYPGSTVVFEGVDPTTEVIAQDVFAFVEQVLKDGFRGFARSGAEYQIPPGRVSLERVRVWETADSWAEYGR